jgi:hypothetical protein
MTVNVCGNDPGGQAGQSTSREPEAGKQAARGGRGQASCAGKGGSARANGRRLPPVCPLSGAGKAPARASRGCYASCQPCAGRRMKRLAARQHSQHLAPDSGRQRSRRAGTLQGHERTLAHAARRARQSARPDPGAARKRGERTDGKKRDQRENLREDAHRPPPRTQAAQQAAELGHRSRGLLQRRTLFPGPPEAVV